MLPEAALAMLMSVTSPDGTNTLTVSREGERLLLPSPAGASQSWRLRPSA